MGVLQTFFASPVRSTEKEIEARRRKVEAQTLFKKALDSLPQILMILDANRQVVYLNEEIFRIIGPADVKKLCGLRSGELFKCVHFADGPNGCGTSKFCQACGFANAVLEVQRTGAKCQREYRLTTCPSGDSFDLKVTASPLTVEDESFTILTIDDISDEKRRQALERIFFHDIMNMAGGIQGISSMLKGKGSTQDRPLMEMMETAANTLVDEIKAQKQLKQAEKGELPVNFEELDALKVIRDAALIYRAHEVAEGKTLVEGPSPKIKFESDRTILSRVIGNMLKNALEATPDGGEVRIGCADMPDTDELEFRVGNPGAIPSDIQLQVFNRSFSTKGEGRGLGTYSIKLLGERYLKGCVGFESSEKAGTVFHIRLKKRAQG